MPKFFKQSKKIFILSGLGVFLVLCLVIANIIASSVIEASTTINQAKSSTFDLYLISLGKSQVELEARTLAEDYQKIGAGGFIWEHNNYYHVISSAYQSKNDALLVQNSIKSGQKIDSELIEVKFKSVEIKGGFDEENAKILTKVLSSFYEFYAKAYDIAISYDTCVYNEISARIEINNAHNVLSTALANFETLFPNDNLLFPLSKVYERLKNAHEASKALCGGMLVHTSQTYSSIIKYRYLQVLSQYALLYQDLN